VVPAGGPVGGIGRKIASTGQRLYDITDHKGNVRATLNDAGELLGGQDYPAALFGTGFLFGKTFRAKTHTNTRYNYSGKFIPQKQS
jgi:hypothetical protein